MELFSVVVFEGGEALDPEDPDRNEVTVAAWSRDELVRVINEYIGPCYDSAGNEIKWEDDVIDECLDPAENGKTLGSTFQFVNKNLAQAVKCAIDGGMIYVVRC